MSTAGLSRAEPAFRQLCHMLSLSKTRKVQSAVDNLVLTTLSIDPKVGDGGDPNELALAVATYFGVTLDVGDVRLAVENHLKAGRLLISRLPDRTRIVLAPDVRASLAERISASEALEGNVRDEWLSLAPVATSTLPEEALWQALQAYLGQVFSEHGAEAVQLLDSRSDVGEDKGNLLTLLDRAIDMAGLGDKRLEARHAIRAFFTAPSPRRLRYMSELLDGTFTFFALTVSDATADYLKGQVPSLRLFLDTNVVLAVLGLQDNPLQEADVELLELIKSEGYPFKLYYHERTLKEILDILDAARNNLKRRHFTPALSQAYLQFMESRGGGFGLERQFHAMNARREMDAEAFLARFDHVEDMLRDKGIHRYNQSGSELHTDTKGEYIAEFEHFLTKRRRQGKPPRRYEALDHDVTVWLYLQRQRAFSTNALRSGALLLSNDYSLHAFDRKFLMSSPDGRRVATVVLPQHLLQILRPFSRVTSDFDKRFLEIFAAPEFRTTQSNYGQTASKVLSYLASFEGVPTETAVHILNDDLLMGRLQDVDESEQAFGDLIESAVIDENNALLARLSDASEVLSAAQAEADRSRELVESERAAREASEARAEEVQLAAQQAASLVVQQLEEAKETEAREAAARRVSEERAEAEASEKATLQDELERERVKRISAEATAEASQRRWGYLQRAGAGVFATVLVGLVWFGPHRFDWDPLLEHRNRMGIQALGCVLVLAIAYLLSGAEKWRAAVIAGVVVGGGITLLSLL